MIEVFKTNVADHEQGQQVVNQIHLNFRDYQANFDLEDCDKILRVKCATRNINTLKLASFLAALGVTAKVLEDEVLGLNPWID